MNRISTSEHCRPRHLLGVRPIVEDATHPIPRQLLLHDTHAERDKGEEGGEEAPGGPLWWLAGSGKQGGPMIEFMHQESMVL